MEYRGTIWLHVLIVFNGFIVLHSVNTWGTVQQFPSQLIPDEGFSPKRAIVRRKVVMYHNFFRTKVQPTASNMLLMTWHQPAAQQAQQYAERCKFLQHNPPIENTVPLYGSCGQNLFVSSHKTPWFFAIKSWFLEYQNFTFGAPNYVLHDIGHYTQMVWATSHKVGCGVALCKGGPWGKFYNYVCHYCPAGNIESLVQYPYKPGKQCTECPGQCVSESLCTNPCPAKDVYSNCYELIKYPGICTQGNCNATCVCGNKRIHKNYPWK
ncbi:serotriflin-like [Hyposmocoma kahamanoa]|uniref:serotriflin-like n=1 Tax=Hyposmocoma kahamanoa TaxID=1477025 RepID=UPI000E6D646E|nr:serotriflin-like [Hyposmocoma kahamanoa]